MAIFPNDLTALRILGDTGASVGPGRAILPVTIPAAENDPTIIAECPAGAWPWAVTWQSNTADVTPTQDGWAIPFTEPQIQVYVDAALAMGTYLKVKSGAVFGDAARAVPCARLLEASAGAGLAWVTTVIGRLRNAGAAVIKTSNPVPYSSATYTTIAEMTTTVVIRTGTSVIGGFCAFDQVGGDVFQLALFVDGGQVGIARPFGFTGLDSKQFAFLLNGITGGSHLFEIRVSASSGAARPYGTSRALPVIEI